ncbi:MAG: hypothetical protein U5L04_03295 [Trueperaceae bacterium]|nr:hypothetical protein [Trueperaceae bacterium]
MLRIALFALIAVVAVLVGLSLLPQQTREIPGSEIALANTALTLYPEADPDAVWFFEAQNAEYQPNARTTTLYNVDDGRRVVNGDTDFTLSADELIIDNRDNLRSDELFVYLIEADWDLHMQADDARQVLIDQSQGKFEVPLLTYSGDGIGESRDENVRMHFDLTDFEAGGPDTVGYNRFADTSGTSSGTSSETSPDTSPGSADTNDTPNVEER